MSITDVLVIEDELPAGANDAYTELQEVIGEAALRVGRQHVEDFPGLLEFIQDDVLFVVGRPARRAHGWFAAETWRNGSAYATEIFISADGRGGHDAATLAREILTTLVHELAHARCHIDGLKDTSRQGRWHNRHFGMTALALGALVAPHPRVGHVTPGLQPQTVSLYAPELRKLEQALILTWAPKAVRVRTPTPGPDSASAARVDELARYVIATCACADNCGRRRAIRVANGWWALGPIICGVCRHNFTPKTRPSSL